MKGVRMRVERANLSSLQTTNGTPPHTETPKARQRGRSDSNTPARGPTILFCWAPAVGMVLGGGGGGAGRQHTPQEKEVIQCRFYISMGASGNNKKEYSRGDVIQSKYWACCSQCAKAPWPNVLQFLSWGVGGESRADPSSFAAHV